MGRDAVLSECAQYLRESSFEYEQLLGSAVDAVWQAISAHVERQLTMMKGVNVAIFGKFTFLRDSQPPAPVFILAERFVNTYGVAWKRPPPALLVPTVDVNMSGIGNDIGIPKEQTLRTLEAVVTFFGTTLQKGSASGRLRVGNVGFVCFEGRALSFAFNPGFTKSIVSSQSTNSSSTTSKSSNTAGALDLRSPTNMQAMRRSISLDHVIPSIGAKSSNTNSGLDLNTLSASGGAIEAHSKTQEQNKSHYGKEYRHREKRGELLSCPTMLVMELTPNLTYLVSMTVSVEHKRHSHTRSSSHLDTTSPHAVERSSSSQGKSTTASSSRQLLPRFLIASKHVPDDAKVSRQIPGSQYALAMQSSFDRELEMRNQKSLAIAREDDAIAVRHHATQLRKLQESAEQAINRRDLNAFFNSQIEEKQAKQRKDRLQTARVTDFESARILPHDPIVTEATKRDAKQYLCKRLEEQVAAKDALRKDKRVLEQAESAYFIAKLKAQTEAEQRELLELKRIDKEALLDGWRQQQALQTQATPFSKRIR